MAQYVKVTEELIESASQRDSRRCMIAEAIQIANPHYRKIMVDLATIRWTNPRTGKRYIALTPEDAGAALVQFDRGEKVEPFSVRLDPIQVTKVAERTVKRDDDGQIELYPSGRPKYAATYKRGRKTIAKKRFGDVEIRGGAPLPTGHLPGTAAATDSRNHPRLKVDDSAPEWKSNTQASRSDVRVFGRRLLKQ